MNLTAPGTAAYNESVPVANSQEPRAVLAPTAMKRLAASIVNLPANLLIAAVRLYQLVISPWLGPVCRFEPTCSNYMIQAVRKYGFVRGSWKGLRRIARCHPLGASGYDPP